MYDKNVRAARASRARFVREHTPVGKGTRFVARARIESVSRVGFAIHPLATWHHWNAQSVQRRQKYPQP